MQMQLEQNQTQVLLICVWSTEFKPKFVLTLLFQPIRSLAKLDQLVGVEPTAAHVLANSCFVLALLIKSVYIQSQVQEFH